MIDGSKNGKRYPGYQRFFSRTGEFSVLAEGRHIFVRRHPGYANVSWLLKMRVGVFLKRAVNRLKSL